MGKVLLLVLLALVAYALWRGSARLRERSKESEKNASSTGRTQLPERMVRCEKCGVHLPASESVVVDRRTFCSHDHARSGGA